MPGYSEILQFNFALGGPVNAIVYYENLYLVDEKYSIHFMEKNAVEIVRLNSVFLVIIFFCSNHLRVDPMMFLEVYLTVNNFNNSYSESILQLFTNNFLKLNLTHQL